MHVYPIRNFVTFCLGVLIKHCLSMTSVSLTDVLVTLRGWIKSSIVQVFKKLLRENKGLTSIEFLGK